jgi:flagellar motor switch protein FliM
MGNILSQEEIDALVRGMDEGKVEIRPETPETVNAADTSDTAGTSEALETPSPSDAAVTGDAKETSRVVPYDFGSQDQLVRGRMPTLDIINDRFAKLFRSSLFSVLHKIIDVESRGIQFIKFGDFVNTLPVPSSLHIFKMDPLRGHALVVLESKLIFTLLDVFLGGTGKTAYKVEGREFTAFESRLILKVVNMIFKDLQEAWDPVYPVVFQYVRGEINPQYATIVVPSDLVILVSFGVELEQPSGTITLCIPYSLIKPIKGALYGRFQGEIQEVDQKWADRLWNRVKGAQFEVAVELGKRQMSIRELLNLKAGDTLLLDKDASEPLVAKVQGVPKFHGRAGVYGANKAIQIEGRIKTS